MNGIGGIVPSVLLMPLLNQRPPNPDVTDQTAYAGLTFTYQVPEVTDPDGDDLTYEAVQGAAYNPLPDWLAFDASTRTFTGTPRSVHIDTYTIRVTVSDGQQTSWAEFSLTVAERPSNLPPTVPTMAAQTAVEDQAFSYETPEFGDPDGNSLTYTASQDDGNSLPAWLSFDAASRTLSGTPLEADTPETHTIRITATDDGNPPLSSYGTFTLTVNEVNDAPVPGNDTASVEVGRSVMVSVTTLLSNDSDPEGNALSVTAVGGAVNGTVTLSDDKSKVTYTHDGSDTTSGSFTYTVSDGTATASGTVAVTVTEPNNPPVAVDDAATVAEGGAVEIASTTLLSDDTDADNDSLSVSGVGGAVNGTVALSEDGSEVTYTHDGSETKSGSFTYTVSDGTDTADGTVSVTVTPVNDPPTARGDTATVAEGGEVEIAVTALLANDSDPEGDSFTFTGLGSAVNGTVALSEDKSNVTYTHDGSETTTGSFTYTVSDGTATGTGTVAVTVTPVNDAPTGVADTAKVDEGGSVDVSVASLLANDTDPEGSDLSISAVSGAVNGTATLSEDKSKVTYAHDGSETTTGSFTYTVSDGTATGTGTVSVTVTPVNDPPAALSLTDQTATTGTDFSYQVPAVTDPDGDALTYAAFLGTGQNPLPSWLSFDEETRTFSCTPRSAHLGEYEIQVTVSDGTAAARKAEFTLTVELPSNRPPVAPALTAQEATEDQAFSYVVTEFDDPEDDTVTYAASLDGGGSLPGWLGFNATSRTLSGTPSEADTPASHTIRITATDDGSPSKSSSATITLTVVEVNDAPVPANDTATVAEGGSVDVTVSTLLGNDSDPEGSTLSVTAVGGAVNGTATLSEDKSKVTYAHDGSETTAGSFTYTVSDGTATGTGTVTITVTPVNDAPVVVNDTATVAEGGSLDVAVTTLLTNDTDPEGSTLGVTAVGSAVNGAVTLSEDKSEVTYAHDGSETTAGSFTYTVSDGTATATGTVTVAVTPVNDPPGALSLSDQTATAGASFSYQVPAVNDPEGDALTYDAFLGTGSNPLPGWLSFDEKTRTFSGTPRSAHVGDYEIQVTVSDSADASEKAKFTLTVELPPNRPPEAPDLSDQAATEDQAFSYEVPEFTDPDGNSLTYTASLDSGGPLPGWLSFNAANRTLSGTPLEADTPASHTIRVTATDDASPSNSSHATFTLTVVEVNDAPSTPSLTDQTAVGSRPFSYTFAAVADPEGGDVTYTASVGESGELPSWLAFDAGSLTLSGTPGESDAAADLVIRITATDAAEPPLASWAEFTLTVRESNGAPQAVDDTADVDEGGSVTISSRDLLANDSDPDGQTLVITGVGNAVYGSATLSADGESVTYRHGGSESVSGSFTYTVSDGAATDTATVRISVTPVNDPPAAPSVSDQTAIEDEQFSYRFAAVTDPESDGVTYSSSLAGGRALPRWLSFDTTTRVFSGTPGERDSPATLTVAVTATDDGEPQESSTSTFTLRVAAVNDPPDAPRVADRTAFVDAPFTYAVPAAYDSDSWPLAYVAAQGLGFNPLPRWLRFDEDTRTFSGTPLLADVGEHEIVVSVSDELNTTWTSFTLTVEVAANGPPVPPRIPPLEATEDLLFTFAVPPFADPDEDLLEYSAGVASTDGAIAGLPSWLAFEPATRILSGTPLEGDTPGVLTLVVTATDDGDPPASAEVRFTLDVAEVNDAPTASAGEDQTVPAAAIVTLDGSGSRDPEGHSLSCTWSQEGGPRVAISGADTAAPTFVAPTQLPPDAELVFTLVVTDVAGAVSEPDTVSIRVVGAARPLGPVVPLISIEAEIASVVEGQVASFRVKAVPSPDRPVAIVMDVEGGDAYGVADGQRDVFILPGGTLAILVLSTEDDDVDEPHGRIEVVIRDQPRYRLATKSSAHVTISDNDSPRPPDDAGTPSARRPPPKSDSGSTLNFGTASVEAMTFYVGRDIGLVQLPRAAGGERRLSYDLSPMLPRGLRFDFHARTITGVPAVALEPTRFKFRVTDSAGNQASLDFLITVVGPAASPTAAAPTPTNTPVPTLPPAPAWTPAPKPHAAPPAGDPPATASARIFTEAPPPPANTMQPPPVPTPTVEVAMPLATAIAVPAVDDQGANRMGWIVSGVLASVTAATGGVVFLRGVRR